MHETTEESISFDSQPPEGSSESDFSSDVPVWYRQCTDEGDYPIRSWVK